MFRRLGILIILLVIIIRLGSMVFHLSDFLSTLYPIYRYPFASYEQKMTLKYPDYFPFLTYIKAIIPENSTINLVSCPSVSADDLLLTNLYNIPLTQAFIYPRNIVSLEKIPLSGSSASDSAYLITCSVGSQPSSLTKIGAWKNVTLWHI